jgi:Sec-independent protein secretion pathway component TatC
MPKIRSGRIVGLVLILLSVVIFFNLNAVVKPGLVEPGSWLAIVIGVALMMLFVVGWVKVAGW